MSNNNLKDIYNPLLKNVNIPIELYESIIGQYFIGYADNLVFGEATSAWARLYNPINSGVILHVNVWTVTGVSDFTFPCTVLV